MESDVSGGYEQPVFDKEPDFVNSIGTKFWGVSEFDEILSKIPVDIQIAYSEHTDEAGEVFWGYVIIEKDEILFESARSSDVQEILETTLEESIERGLVEFVPEQ